MAKLILSLESMVLREIKLETDKLKIGRKPHNDLQIDNLAVSGEHAVITTIQGDSFLEDLNSTNGTMINGKPVQKHFLQDGDVIELGKYKLKYMREPGARATQENFEKTMIIKPSGVRPSAPAAEPLRPEAAASTQSFPPMHASASSASDQTAPHTPIGETVQVPPQPPLAERTGVVRVLTGSNAGKQLDLVKSLTSLGKPGVQVAIITKRPNGYFLTHVEGPKPPTVNGTEIGMHAHELKEQDIIELAGIKMEFFHK